MTKDEYLKYHEEMCRKMIETTRKKNADYTGSNPDPFANFTRCEEGFGVATTEQGFFVRLTDKFSRIASFIQKGVLLVKDESIEDTLIDLANYCILFAGYIKSKKMIRHEAIDQDRIDALRYAISSMPCTTIIPGKGIRETTKSILSEPTEPEAGEGIRV